MSSWHLLTEKDFSLGRKKSSASTGCVFLIYNSFKVLNMKVTILGLKFFYNHVSFSWAGIWNQKVVSCFFQLRRGGKKVTSKGSYGSGRHIVIIATWKREKNAVMGVPNDQRIYSFDMSWGGHLASNSFRKTRIEEGVGWDGESSKFCYALRSLQCRWPQPKERFLVTFSQWSIFYCLVVVLIHGGTFASANLSMVVQFYAFFRKFAISQLLSVTPAETIPPPHFVTFEL